MRGAGHTGLGSTWSPAHRSLGDVTVDTTYTDPGAGIVDPTLIDTSNLPLENIVSPPLTMQYPASIGLEFVSNGDGTYTNIQTGQSVPYDTAAAITQATGGSAPITAPLQSAQNNQTLVDAAAGMPSGIANLTTAAQALQSAGQLVNAAGKLTAQGQALANAGNLYNPAPVSSSGLNFSGAMSSLTSWMSSNQNLVLIGGAGLLALIFLPSIISAARGGKKRRRNPVDYKKEFTAGWKAGSSGGSGIGSPIYRRAFAIAKKKQGK